MAGRWGWRQKRRPSHLREAGVSDIQADTTPSKTQGQSFWYFSKKVQEKPTRDSKGAYNMWFGTPRDRKRERLINICEQYSTHIFSAAQDIQSPIIIAFRGTTMHCNPPPSTSAGYIIAVASSPILSYGLPPSTSGCFYA
jgi:hypothetical protein